MDSIAEIAVIQYLNQNGKAPKDIHTDMVVT